VARIERGRQSPSTETLGRLVAACGIDFDPALPAEGTPAPARLDRRLLRCDIGEAAYALPLSAVLEVVAYVAPRRLPGQPAGAGVALVRGRVVATLDAAARLGLPAPEPARNFVLVTTRAGEHAVAVRAARGIVELDAGHLAPAPRAAGASPAVAGLAEIEGVLVVVLDPDELCRYEQAAATAST
jgi:chemotaxis signal transduction protein